MNASSFPPDTCSSFPECSIAGPNNSPLSCCQTPQGCCAETAKLLDCCVPPPTTTGPVISESRSNTTIWIVLAIVGLLICIVAPWKLWKKYSSRRRQIHVGDGPTYSRMVNDV